MITSLVAWDGVNELLAGATNGHVDRRKGLLAARRLHGQGGGALELPGLLNHVPHVHVHLLLLISGRRPGANEGDASVNLELLDAAGVHLR